MRGVVGVHPHSTWRGQTAVAQRTAGPSYPQHKPVVQAPFCLGAAREVCTCAASDRKCCVPYTGQCCVLRCGIVEKGAETVRVATMSSARPSNASNAERQSFSPHALINPLWVGIFHPSVYRWCCLRSKTSFLSVNAPACSKMRTDITKENSSLSSE